MNRDELLRTQRFSVHRVRRELPDGTVNQREVIRHRGSVVILPAVDAERVCLIRNYRIAVDQPLIELPAGTLELDEPIAECATRELIEETGYRAGRMQKCTSFFAAPGILDEEMHLFLANDLTPGPPAREAGEEIENMVVTWEQARNMIRRGEICDAKTIAGLLFYLVFESGGNISR